MVVLGGSFAGVQLAKRLIETLPTGYRVILIEKNSHFNYLFNFPRYSVLQGHEQKAFVPYGGMAQGAPKGIFELVHDLATGIGDGVVELKSGARVEFEYLAIATGTRQNPPAQVRGTEKSDGCAELKDMQKKIEDIKSIAIVGGGPVGVQLAGDIKTFYEDKRVVLVHSREQLLPNFGKGLHDYVVDKMLKMDVDVRLGERPKLMNDAGPMRLEFKDGGSEEFHLVVCPSKNLRIRFVNLSRRSLVQDKSPTHPLLASLHLKQSHRRPEEFSSKQLCRSYSAIIPPSKDRIYSLSETLQKLEVPKWHGREWCRQIS